MSPINNSYYCPQPRFFTGNRWQRMKGIERGERTKQKPTPEYSNRMLGGRTYTPKIHHLTPPQQSRGE